jgi:CheY-like chemotaxis protein
MLAERAQLHRTYVAHVERGARNVSLSSIHRLARALEVPVAALMARATQVAGKSKNGTHLPSAEAVDILLVEDNPSDVELTLGAFKKARISNTIHVVRDGAEAIDFLFPTVGRERKRRPLPHLVLLDLYLPKVSGIEILRRLKADESTREIPVVVLTASQQDRDFAACRRLGADTYIVKPVDFQKFSQTTPQFQFFWSLLKMPPIMVS